MTRAPSDWISIQRQAESQSTIPLCLIGGSRADLTGRIDPVRSADGKLQALNLALKARNVSIDPDGTFKQVIPIDRIDFDGVASVGEAGLEVNDLIIVAGPAAVRLRGEFTGGERSVGMRWPVVLRRCLLLS